MSIVSAMNVFLDFGIGGVVIADVAASRGSGNTAKAKKLLKEYLTFEIITGLILFAAAFILSFLPMPRTEWKYQGWLK